jgi:hypothetical protein
MNGLKMLVIGFLLGTIIMLVLGANGSQKADFGFALPANGCAIVTDSQGNLFVIDGVTGQATRVLYSDSVGAKDYPTVSHGKQLSIAKNAGLYIMLLSLLPTN